MQVTIDKTDDCTVWVHNLTAEEISAEPVTGELESIEAAAGNFQTRRIRIGNLTINLCGNRNKFDP
jgi:hypothetical protein